MINTLKFSAEELRVNAANILIEKLNKFGQEGKRCLLLLSGGSAVSLYQNPAEYIDKLQIRSDFLAFGQVDERFRPYNIEKINAVAIEKTGLIEKLESRAIPFYRIPQSGDMREAAFNYDRLLKKLFRKYDFHLAVLGIGQDGHTAGLLRGYRSEWDKDRLVIGYETRGEFRQRITITPDAFRNLDYGLIFAAGADKKEVADRILNKSSDDVNNLPGILIHKIKEVDLVRNI